MLTLEPSGLAWRHVGRLTAKIDNALAKTSNAFDLLMTLTPTSGEAAYRRFLSNGCDRAPEFSYRPIDFDPSLLKRHIYNLRIEAVEDPTLAGLLREQREHIDNQLSMIEHRNTPKCLYDSLKVYGGVEDRLRRLALGILEAFDSGNDADSQQRIGAREFVTLAQQEFTHYRRLDPSFDARVEVRSDVSSLTVSRKSLLVPENTRLVELRARALLAHEVGTHLLTHHNAQAQPLELLVNGLAGYEQLQEGMAVVSEYLVGGLTSDRLRLLAARVVAVRMLLHGGSFVEVFRELHDNTGLPSRSAFFTALRVFRAGGFTKDAIYLRGVLDVLDYLGKNRPIELLWLGKFATAHVDSIQELRRRRVLRSPALQPRVLESATGRKRLSVLVGKRRSVLDLCAKELS